MTINTDQPTVLDGEQETYLIFLEDGEHPNGVIGAAKRRFKEDYGITEARASILFNYNAMYYVSVSEVPEANWHAMRVLHRNKDEVEVYLNGDKRVLNYFVGQFMERTGGSYDPSDVEELLKSLLEAIPDGETL